MREDFTLSYKYNFDLALARLAGDPVNVVDLEARLVRVPMEEGNVVTIRGTGTAETPSFRIEGFLDEKQLKAIRSIFHMDESLEKVTRHFLDTDLAPIFVEHSGTPLVKSFSLYGTLMRSIIHQQLNMSFANTLTMRFVEKFGDEVEGVWRYPSPARIAELDLSDLRNMQFSMRKAEYMIGISKAIADGSLDLEEIKELPDEEVMKKLTAFRGIGPWTAQNFLMFGLGRPNLFPVADIGLQNALQRLWGLDRKPTKEEIVVCFPEWTPYLSYAALYLWRSIEP